jgi:hypothetical protein
MARFLMVICLIPVLCSPAAHGADAPTVSRLFPPGGQRGGSVEAKLSGKAGDGVLQVWSDRDQLQFTLSDKRDAVTVDIPADASGGTHWLRFYNETGATGLIPFIVGLVPEAASIEPNNDTSQAQPVELPSVTINGVLEKTDDVDVFAVNLSAGKTFVASLLAQQEVPC